MCQKYLPFPFVPRVLLLLLLSLKLSSSSTEKFPVLLRYNPWPPSLILGFNALTRGLGLFVAAETSYAPYPVALDCPAIINTSPTPISIVNVLLDGTLIGLLILTAILYHPWSKLIDNLYELPVIGCTVVCTQPTVFMMDRFTSNLW